jgi:hypothetical protein
MLGPETLPGAREPLDARRAALVAEMPLDGVAVEASVLTIGERIIRLRISERSR